jgi:hypothetical protein
MRGILGEGMQAALLLLLFRKIQSLDLYILHAVPLLVLRTRIGYNSG